nr:MAG TPA: hypothetical protein [Caudoviricetes sp.]
MVLLHTLQLLKFLLIPYENVLCPSNWSVWSSTGLVFVGVNRREKPCPAPWLVRADTAKL